MFKSLKLIKLRNKESKLLMHEEKVLFEEIVNEIYTSHLSFYEKELVLQDILDMFIENQSVGKTVDFIVGEDYRVFCKDIIESYYNKSSKALFVLGYIQRALIIAVILSLIFSRGMSMALDRSEVIAVLMFSCLFGVGKFSITREFSKYNLKKYKYRILVGGYNYYKNTNYSKIGVKVLLLSIITFLVLASIGVITNTITLSIGSLAIIMLLVIALQVLKMALIKNYKAVD